MFFYISNLNHSLLESHVFLFILFCRHCISLIFYCFWFFYLSDCFFIGLFLIIKNGLSLCFPHFKRNRIEKGLHLGQCYRESFFEILYFLKPFNVKKVRPKVLTLTQEVEESQGLILFNKQKASDSESIQSDWYMKIGIFFRIVLFFELFFE